MINDQRSELAEKLDKARQFHAEAKRRYDAGEVDGAYLNCAKYLVKSAEEALSGAAGRSKTASSEGSL